jgi:hypothetical protein
MLFFLLSAAGQISTGKGICLRLFVCNICGNNESSLDRKSHYIATCREIQNQITALSTHLLP